MLFIIPAAEGEHGAISFDSSRIECIEEFHEALSKSRGAVIKVNITMVSGVVIKASLKRQMLDDVNAERSNKPESLIVDAIKQITTIAQPVEPTVEPAVNP